MSAPRHYSWDSALWAYGPYAKELDLWAELFDQVVIAGPHRNERPPADAVRFRSPNIRVDPVIETGGDSILAKLRQVALLPILLIQLARRIRQADAVHIRGPANLSLLSTLMAPLLRRPMCAKYAGQWGPYPGERRLVTLQRWLFRRWFLGPVTVYGKTARDPEHIVDFFTAMLTRAQVDEAMAKTSHKSLEGPLTVVFLGRLYEGKGVLELLDAVAELEGTSRVDLRIVGDGPLFRAAQKRIEQLDIQDRVLLLGAMPHEEALQQLADADLLVLASQHEGWPKVLTEAMVHHCLCIAPRTGLMGSMIEGRGCALEGLSSKDIATAIRTVQHDRGSFRRLLAPAASWAAQHSTEGLRDAIRETLERTWHTDLSRDNT